MSGEVARHEKGNWLPRTFGVGDRVRLKHDRLLGRIEEIERSDRPKGNGWHCAYLVRWDGEAGTQGPERCHPAQLVPEGAPDEDDA